MDPEYQDTTEGAVKMCPECGVSMEDRDPKAHALSHWPSYIDPKNPKNAEAIKRQAFLTEGS